MSTESSRIATGSNLVDLTTPLVRLLSDLQPSTVDAGFRPKVEDLLRDFENRALRLNYGQAEVKHAQYALCALVDEIILLSELPVKDEWLGRPLQMQFFDDVSAGEEFYNRLDQLRLARTKTAADVLEVYHLCLALGFRGKYGNPKGQERVQVLLQGLANDICAARDTTAQAPLSPHGLANDQLPASAVPSSLLRRAPVWAVPLGVLVVVLAVYLICDAISAAGLASFSDAMRNGGQP